MCSTDDGFKRGARSFQGHRAGDELARIDIGQRQNRCIFHGNHHPEVMCIALQAAERDYDS